MKRTGAGNVKLMPVTSDLFVCIPVLRASKRSTAPPAFCCLLLLIYPCVSVFIRGSNFSLRLRVKAALFETPSHVLPRDTLKR